MRIARAFRLKVDMLIVFHPSEREGTRPVNPGVVVLGDDRASLARCRIKREHPAILVIGRTAHQNSLCSILGPDWLRKLDFTFAWLIRSRTLSASRSAGFRPPPFALIRFRLLDRRLC